MLSICKYKKIILPFILIAFLAVMFLGFNSMIQESYNGMYGDCPFSTMGSGLCSQNNVAMAFHHISLYQAFINIPVNFNIIVLTLLFLAISIIFIFSINHFLHKPSINIKRIIDSPPYTSYSRKILHWLSIFENSPSFL